MLREWLQSSPNPTWSDLVKALRSPDINRPDVAAEIEDKFIKSDDSSVQESTDTAGEWCSTLTNIAYRRNCIISAKSTWRCYLSKSYMYHIIICARACRESTLSCSFAVGKNLSYKIVSNTLILSRNSSCMSIIVSDNTFLLNVHATSVVTRWSIYIYNLFLFMQAAWPSAFLRQSYRTVILLTGKKNWTMSIRIEVILIESWVLFIRVCVFGIIIIKMIQIVGSGRIKSSVGL